MINIIAVGRCNGPHLASIVIVTIALHCHLYTSLLLDVWTPFTGEELTVQQDDDNEHDDYVVGVLKDGVGVVHVPKEFSCIAGTS